MFWILEFHDISALIYVYRFFRVNTIFSSSQTRLRALEMALLGWRAGSLGVMHTMKICAVLQTCSYSKNSDSQGRRPHIHNNLSQPLLCPFCNLLFGISDRVFSCRNDLCGLGKRLRSSASATPNAFPPGLHSPVIRAIWVTISARDMFTFP